MSVFARFKYDENYPAFRVHIWDIFDEANLTTDSFETLIDSIYDQLAVKFEDEGFDTDCDELSSDHEISAKTLGLKRNRSEDSADAQFEAINKLTKFNIFKDDNS